ncbi:uncharacterized protein LOC121282330 isoform X2 [Carcharodon carcharias]|uniref:uncharacterized protein LOC121282330 isoform X2 n=1 Tax=Carcharodon carcharias TaxID=13397 RepID=UPI001B7F4661|nr:uncharacterized protein LOC121282330 isoform X2 [Carcharodon carcharias]
MAKSPMSIIMFLHHLLYVLGQLPTPPRNVNLTSVNFRYFVTWEPGTGSPPGARYTVATCNLSGTGIFIPVKKCINISTLSCDLSQTFKTFSDLYWVQVMSITSTSKSKWVESNELLPLRDTILGPPIINVTSNNQTIEVTLDMPLTPHKDNNKPKKVNNIDQSLIYIVTLLDKDNKEYAFDKVAPDESGKGYYQFENLKPKFTYCVVAKFGSTANHHTKDSRKICATMLPKNADMMWIAPLTAVLVFIAGTIICIVVIWILKEFAHLLLTQSQLPKSLVIISEDLHVNLHCNEMGENLEGDHISFLTQDDRSNDYQLKFQSSYLASKVQHTSHNCVTDADESTFYQSNGLSIKGYEHNSLMKETDICMYRGIGGPLPYRQSSIENRDSESPSQQNSPAIPVSYNLQHQQLSSLKDTEETRSSNVDENNPMLKNLLHGLDTWQKIQVETTSAEFWKWEDVPLSSVKLSFNDNSERGNPEVSTCGDETPDLLSIDDLCSQFTCHLTAATDRSLNSNQEYRAQSIKLPQVINDYEFQNMLQKPIFHISEIKTENAGKLSRPDSICEVRNRVNISSPYDSSSELFSYL